MASLVGYFDESAKGRVYTVAGYLGMVEHIEDEFAPAWTGVLDQAEPRRPREFHAGDREMPGGPGGVFSGWTKDQTNKLTVDLIDVIRTGAPREHMTGISASVVFPHDPTEGEQRHFEDFGYGWCMSFVIIEVLRIASGLLKSKADDVRFVHDRKTTFHHFVRNGWAGVRSILGERVTCRVHDPSPEDSEEQPVLQAADLLAYETMKEVQNRLRGAGPRRAMPAILAARFHRGMCAEYTLFELWQSQKERGEKWTTDPPILYDSSRDLRAPGNWRC